MRAILIVLAILLASTPLLEARAPDFYDVLTGALQELLGGQVTAEEFQTTLQDFYAASFA